MSNERTPTLIIDFTAYDSGAFRAVLDAFKKDIRSAAQGVQRAPEIELFSADTLRSLQILGELFSRLRALLDAGRSIPEQDISPTRH